MRNNQLFQVKWWNLIQRNVHGLNYYIAYLCFFYSKEQDFEEGEERRVKGGIIGKTVTLQMLLAADILSPGEANMSIEYMVSGSYDVLLSFIVRALALHVLSYIADVYIVLSNFLLWRANDFWAIYCRTEKSNLLKPT